MRKILRVIILLFQCFFYWWKKNPSGDFIEGDVVVALSFGFRKDSPGLSNEAIARLVEKLHQVLSLPLIFQWGIADALKLKPDSLFVIREHRVKGKYLDTYEAVVQTREIMLERGWKKVIVVAHPWHVWRVGKVFEKMGIETIGPLFKNIPFDSQSQQLWTRNFFWWIIREIPSRLIYLARGWI